MIRRILILGLPGSGKTTLARRLAARTGLPHVEVDTIFWTAERRENPEFLVQAEAAIAGDRWIVEGHFSKLKDRGLTRAECVVWLKPPWPLVAFRYVKRGGSLRWLVGHRPASEILFREAVNAARSAGVLTLVIQPGFFGGTHIVEKEISAALGLPPRS